MLAAVFAIVSRLCACVFAGSLVAFCTARVAEAKVSGASLIYVVNDQTLKSAIPAAITPASPATVPDIAASSPRAITIGSLDAAAQGSALVRAFERRGFRATADYPTFYSECRDAQRLTVAEPLQIHWRLGDANYLSTISQIELTTASVSLYWTLYGCDAVALGASDQQMFYAHETTYRRYSARIPLNTILALITLTNALHTDTVHAPLIAGFSAGVGSINTFLDFADPQANLAERSFWAAADKLAADLCGIKMLDNATRSFDCLRVPRIRA